MAKNKRTSAQRALDLALIEKLALRGFTELEIAAALSKQRDYSLSRQQIGYDLIKLTRQWQWEALVDLDDAKARALAELRHLQKTFWNAWFLSAGEGGVGNPRFLRGVLSCLDKKCEILGLNAAKQLDLDWKSELRLAGIDSKSADELYEELVQLTMDHFKKSSGVLDE